MTQQVSPADMMEARDVVGRAYYAMKSADAAWDRDPSEMTCAAAGRAQRVWVKAVREREAMERSMWRQQDAA